MTTVKFKGTGVDIGGQKIVDLADGSAATDASTFGQSVIKTWGVRPVIVAGTSTTAPDRAIWISTFAPGYTGFVTWDLSAFSDHLFLTDDTASTWIDGDDFIARTAAGLVLAGSGSGGAVIDDATPTATTVYSSTKVETLILAVGSNFDGGNATSVYTGVTFNGGTASG